MTINDTKLVYPEFKFFKNIYTKINITKELILEGESINKVNLSFISENSFYKLFGILSANTEFSKWLVNKAVKCKMEDLITIGKTLKKNALEIEYTDEYFKFKFLDKDNNDKEIIFMNDETIKNKSSLFDIEMTTEDLDESFLKDDILKIFLKDNKITEERTEDKLLEIPKGKLDALLKDRKNKISFSNKNEKGMRYVLFESISDELGLTLKEFFKTI